MKKKIASFACIECGSVQQKWSGQCGACGAWDSIIEEKSDNSNYNYSAKQGLKPPALAFSSLDSDISDYRRITTNMNELDRVLGGGMVPGSAILIGGDPGIGKSTLLLQLVSSLSQNNLISAYISGEESLDQIRLRAKRLEINKANISILSATNVSEIISTLAGLKNCNLIIIDSIQTMFLEVVASSPGTVSQVRASAHEIITFAKQNNIAVILVGHVTKDGQIAGPKVLEHMVDTVLYFEGERGHQFRILRAVKNRYGAANEIGVFEMQSKGLIEVANPSSLFLAQREENISGSAVFAGIEGTRPVLVEIQALVSGSQINNPRRAVVGWDHNRLSMVIAIIQTRFGIFLGDKEIYLNVAGGLKIDEPAADLAVAAAIISSISDIALPNDAVIFGEMGLSGEIRSVSQADTRIKEAQKLGFKLAISPKIAKFENNDFILNEIKHIRELGKFFRKKQG